MSSKDVSETQFLDHPDLPFGALVTLGQALLAAVPGDVLSSFPVSLSSGSDGLPPMLTIGDKEAPNLFVVSSGLHGVEGRFGFLLQQKFVSQLLVHHLRGVRVAIPFALNRSGFMTARRWCSNNCDLNRAFSSEKLPNHPAWVSLYEHFGPYARRPSWPRFCMELGKNLISYGWKNLFEGLPGGQNRYPDFIFFNDSASATGVVQIQECLRSLIKLPQTKNVLHVDVHTGLGERGKVQILSPVGFSRLSLAQSFRNMGSSYQALGSLTQWCGDTFGRRYKGCVLEIGTSPALNVFLALLAENHSFQRGETQRNKEDRSVLLNHFFPKSRIWREQALENGCTIVKKFLKSGRAL
jgi:Protein of unknown function (DUF2817)